MVVHELCVVVLRPRDRASGYLRESDLTTDVFGAVGWYPGTAPEERRVTIDLRNVVHFGAGTVEKLARVLVDAGANVVQVNGDRKAGMRNAFTAQLRQACSKYEQEVSR